MSKRTVYSILIIICIIGFWIFENFYTPANYSLKERGKNSGVVDKTLLPSSSYGNIVQHEHFVLSYSEPHEQAEWVAYPLKREHLTHDDRRRPYFIEDPKVNSKSADWRNYRGSGYDRGHLVASANHDELEIQNSETFLLSNMSPQKPDFNRRMWRDLELAVRKLNEQKN